MQDGVKRQDRVNARVRYIEGDMEELGSLGHSDTRIHFLDPSLSAHVMKPSAAWSASDVGFPIAAAKRSNQALGKTDRPHSSANFFGPGTLRLGADVTPLQPQEAEKTEWLKNFDAAPEPLTADEKSSFLKGQLHAVRKPIMIYISTYLYSYVSIYPCICASILYMYIHNTYIYIYICNPPPPVPRFGSVYTVNAKPILSTLVCLVMVYQEPSDTSSRQNR